MRYKAEIIFILIVLTIIAAIIFAVHRYECKQDNYVWVVTTQEKTYYAKREPFAETRASVSPVMGVVGTNVGGGMAVTQQATGKYKFYTMDGDTVRLECSFETKKITRDEYDKIKQKKEIEPNE